MSTELLVQQLEQQIIQLPPQAQLQLVAHISDRLSKALPASTPESALTLEQPERDAADILALCDAAANMWDGSFDAVEDIRQMRQERAVHS